MRSEYWIMLVAWAVMPVWVAFVIALNRKQHPKALFLLFAVELWERFSYYGMRAFLILYLTKSAVEGGMGYTKPEGYGIYGAYGALVYLIPLAGGFLADRILGFRKSIIWGALLMAAGQFTLFASADSKVLLYLGLALLVTGNGFFKPNISSLVGKFYTQGDPRRDGAFTIFYMGINIGALLAPLTCGVVAELEGWNYGFLLAGMGMLIGLGLFLYTAASGALGDKADPPPPGGAPARTQEEADYGEAQAGGATPVKAAVGNSAAYLVFLGSLLFLPVICLLMYRNDVMDYLLGGVGLAVLVYMLILSAKYQTVERQRIWVIIILLFFTTIFWSFFELAGAALNVFTDNNVRKVVEVGSRQITLTTTFFQAVNPMFIILFAPLFSAMWTSLAKANLEPPAPVKFGAGLVLLGAGFLVLNLGRPAAVEGIMPVIFLILLYLLHTLGELALSPVGLSLVTKLAPAQVVGFMMGFWFLSSSIAHQAVKHISRLTAVEENAPPQESMDQALSVFNNVGLFAIGSGVLLFVLTPLIRKWMHGVK